jgi:hypothetical protein
LRVDPVPDFGPVGPPPDFSFNSSRKISHLKKMIFNSS